MVSHSRRPNHSSNSMSISFLLNGDDEGHEDVMSSGGSSRSDTSNVYLTDCHICLPSLQPWPQADSFHPVRSNSSSARPGTPLTRCSSGSSSRSSQQANFTLTRAPRPPYPKEHKIFIWYVKTDRRMAWDQVLGHFGRTFPDSEIRTVPGLQGVYYRTLIEWAVPRIQGRDRDEEIGRYGVVQRTSLRYHWMEEHHRVARCLPEFEQSSP